jgi:hypothetical protein
MPYLIDGHNLIGQLPDMDLADPDDEAKLVLKLRRFAGQTGKRIIVVFDAGLPGGVSTKLSTHSVKVRFAPESLSADHVLRDVIRRIDNAVGWIVVSSDVEVTDLAELRGMRCIPSHQFAKELAAPARPNRRNTQPIETSDKKANPRLSRSEIEEWLRVFGENGDQES